MKTIWTKLEKVCERLWLPLFFFFAVVVAVFYGLIRIETVDFVCTNGDYQNYNVLRRFLDGQIPYRDFSNYLGMGVLITCAPLLSLHNTFAGSLFVTNIVASFMFIAFVTVVFYLITGQKLFSIAAGLIFPKIISSGILLLIPMYGYYTNWVLEMIYLPGNSFRIARMFWPVLLCGIALLAMRWLRRGNPDISLRDVFSTRWGVVALGFVLGFGITWSNDFGFACIGSGTLILVILTIADLVQWKKNICNKMEHSLGFSRFFYYIPALFAGALCSALLASGGDLKSYLSFTADVGGWQFWYFSRSVEDKMYSVVQVFNWEKNHRTILHLMFYLSAMGVALYRLCRHKENDRLVLLVFLFTSIVAAQFVYIVGNGRDNFTEGTYGFVILAFYALLIKLGLWLVKRWKLLPLAKAMGVFVIACYVALIFRADWQQVQHLKALNLTQDNYYVPELEGVSADAPALRSMQEIVGNDPIFSTYATALDDMLGNYQPTGSDYIIHALGTKRFAAYVQTFKENSYPWVQTTNFNNWHWEPWLVSASWDFYRELFRDYTVHSDHGMWTLWQYTGENANLMDVEVTIEVIPLNENETEIRVTSTEKGPCYVDVILSWENAFVANWDRLLTWRRAIYVYDSSQSTVRKGFDEGYFRPAESENHHLLIYMENGQGRIVLSGQPANCTRLVVKSAEVGEVIRFQR